MSGFFETAASSLCQKLSPEVSRLPAGHPVIVHIISRVKNRAAPFFSLLLTCKRAAAKALLSLTMCLSVSFATLFKANIASRV